MINSAPLLWAVTMFPVWATSTFFSFLKPLPLTILEDSLHVEPVGGAGLVVRAALQVVRQLSGPRVIDHSGVGGADCIWERFWKKNIYNMSVENKPFFI